MRRSIGKVRFRQLQEATRARSFWLDQLQRVIGDGSELSGRSASVLRGAFLGAAASTLSRWKAVWIRRVTFCDHNGIHPAKFSVVQLGEFCDLVLPADPELEDSSPAQEGAPKIGSGPAVVRGTLGALAFVAKRCKVPAIAYSLADPCIIGFRKPAGLQSEKREAVPLPLAAVW